MPCVFDRSSLHEEAVRQDLTTVFFFNYVDVKIKHRVELRYSSLGATKQDMRNRQFPNAGWAMAIQRMGLL